MTPNTYKCFFINLLNFPESEPRDAGTDQRSSGIIRLHTIKQIIDRVSVTPFNHRVYIIHFCILPQLGNFLLSVL